MERLGDRGHYERPLSALVWLMVDVAQHNHLSDSATVNTSTRYISPNYVGINAPDDVAFYVLCNPISVKHPMGRRRMAN